MGYRTPHPPQENPENPKTPEYPEYPALFKYTTPLKKPPLLKETSDGHQPIIINYKLLIINY